MKGNSEFHFTSSKFYGTGSSSTTVSSNQIYLEELIQGQTTFNLTLNPHVLSLYSTISGESNDLYTYGNISQNLITYSDIVLPDIEGAWYKVWNYVEPLIESKENLDFMYTGYRGVFITFYSYPEGDIEDFGEVPTFTEGQQITFKLTMKKPSGEVILDNKQITLNFI